MAYVPQQQDDEEKRKLEAGGGALGSFGSTQGASAPTTPKFVNVADYLSKNPTGSANIGELASNKLAGQRDEAQGAVTDTGTKFNTAVEQGTTKLDTSVLDSALSNPTTFTQDPGNVAKFAALRDASYKGPASVQGTENFAPTQAKVSALAPLASSIGTESGRNDLVRGLSERPTEGKTALNQLLLQGSPEASQKVADTAGTFKSVEDQWNSLLQNAPATADAARATTDATRATTQGRLGEAVSGFNTGLDTRLQDARSQANTANQGILKGVTDRSLTPEQLASLGVSTDDWNQILSGLTNVSTPRSVSSNQGQFGATTGTVKDYDLNQWLQQLSPDTEITKGNVASADDYAREAALEALSGGSMDTLDNTQSALAGTAPTKLSTFGATGARDQLSAIDKDQMSSAQAYVDALQAGADEEHAQLAAANAQKNLTMGGLAYTPAAASYAGAKGIAEAGQNVGSQYATPQNAAKNVALNVATGGLATPVQAVGAGVQKAVDTIGQVFCFAADTLVTMADGTKKAIQYVGLNEKVKGGSVISIRQSLSDHIYNYCGVSVTGKHAVLEDKWIRVEDSPLAIKDLTPTIVYSLVTTDHRLSINGITFADEHETNEYETLTLDESLKALNEQAVEVAA